VRRALFDDAHEHFRASFGRFLEREIKTSYDESERHGIVARELFARAGAGGFLGMAAPDRYDGAGVADFRLNLIIGEECHHAGVGAFGLGITLHDDISPLLPRLLRRGAARAWLPGIADRRLITAMAMTEPQTGSDLAGIATRARREDAESVMGRGGLRSRWLARCACLGRRSALLRLSWLAPQWRAPSSSDQPPRLQPLRRRRALSPEHRRLWGSQASRVVVSPLSRDGARECRA